MNLQISIIFWSFSFYIRYNVHLTGESFIFRCLYFPSDDIQDTRIASTWRYNVLRFAKYKQKCFVSSATRMF